MPFAGAIHRHADDHPYAPAFRIEGRVFTFGELRRLAEQLVAIFGDLIGDSEPRSVLGDRGRLVALEVGNHPLFAAAFLAATSRGHCVALIDPHLPHSVRQSMHERLSPDLVIGGDGDGLRLEALASGKTRRFAANDDGAKEVRLAVGADTEPFLIVFTSGTTGTPKAIVRDRGSWRRSLATGQEFFEICRDSRTFAPGPLAHGLTLYALAETLVAGAEFIGATHFDAAQSLAVIEAEEVQRLVLVPTMLRRLCAAATGKPQGSVARITVAGAKLTPSDRASAALAFPEARVIEYYGASELGFISVATESDTAAVTAVGRAFPGVAFQILNDTGNAVPPGETGTIFVDSALVSDGYVGADDGAGFRRFGQLATVGDLGFIDGEGTLHLLGRAGGMVLSGGNNIYPQEVEATLVAYPGVHAALVLGLDHPDLGTELVAVIEPEGRVFDREALDRHLAAHLPRYKHPRRIWLCRRMPMTQSGKVAAGKLRQWIADENDDLERID
ncbi:MULTISPECIES: AMP-binding protein [unclassified Ensifer]|uniref:class I adenylate-forming enzyme family protein n=1 Tax=unclassified Ensifer TaxID=2633371 RepID=UPI000813143B|nr:MULTISPECIES: AMP-binding protein [unclassified Ensifer]OCO99863.1 long-chain fatty acid--CoA ligase [Ensifer sp. LC14]OCP06138.1 long-chain fatty acid--CoA ligase [Ensifer sp. LC11]OCP07087.1 long-chain fatty acid--CoA ligase [Ensifer sp. LC13]OCP31543.1 long-chain fatty acid--CoA ligase [Ensifer sp. LC499]